MIKEEITTGDFTSNIEDSPYKKDFGWGRGGNKLFRRRRKTRKREYKVFDVSPSQYLRCKDGKRKYQKYTEMLGEDEVSREISEYAKENPDMPLIVREPHSGDISFLRYGSFCVKNINDYRYQI